MSINNNCFVSFCSSNALEVIISKICLKKVPTKWYTMIHIIPKLTGTATWKNWMMNWKLLRIPFWGPFAPLKKVGFSHPGWLEVGSPRSLDATRTVSDRLTQRCATERNPQRYIYPIGSMYGIFTYIWLVLMVIVGKYTIHGCYGYRPINQIRDNLSRKCGLYLESSSTLRWGRKKSHLSESTQRSFWVSRSTIILQHDSWCK